MVPRWLAWISCGGVRGLTLEPGPLVVGLEVGQEGQRVGMQPVVGVVDPAGLA